jgi:hypothetical protein
MSSSFPLCTFSWVFTIYHSSCEIGLFSLPRIIPYSHGEEHLCYFLNGRHRKLLLQGGSVILWTIRLRSVAEQIISGASFR